MASIFEPQILVAHLDVPLLPGPDLLGHLFAMHLAFVCHSLLQHVVLKFQFFV